MKFSNQLSRLASLLTIALWTSGAGMFSINLHAAEQPEGKHTSDSAQRTFASPDEALKALQAAAEAKDDAALEEIFGPGFKQLLTGDKVQDANNIQKFSAAMAEGVTPVKDGEDKITYELGANNWPMPIPLVQTNGQWRFDTDAGKEEIINRHIGKDELHAIGVCRAYVKAQQQYAGENTDGTGIKYAKKFKSASGKKDGLYWPSAENASASPFGPLVAEAHAEGYGGSHGAGPHPFHGYYFRILTRQGDAAAGGKMNYITHGDLTRGFALVAYPEHWDQSGIMTFIVNQDGKVYQRNLGEKTSRLAARLKDYNPDGEWTVVQDEGVDAVTEK